jgi:cytidine deaminase
MDEKQTELVEAAQAVCKELKLSNDFSAATVGAAIRTEAGSIYTGVCIDLACGLGFCAEAAAIAEMLKNRETRIIAVTAVGEDGTVMPPCGRCREMMAQVNAANMDAQIILHGNRSVKLRELLPEHLL